MNKPNVKLKTKLFSKSIKQKELAAMTGIGQTRMSDIVNGWKVPTDKEQALIAKALNCEVADVFLVKKGAGK